MSWGFWGWDVPQARYDPATSTLAGIPQATLQAYLSALQNCRMQLMSNSQVASASYTQGDGSKTVTFRKADLSALMNEIKQVQMQLGVAGVSRRAYRPVF